MSLTCGFLGDQYNSAQFSETMDFATQDLVANVGNKFNLRLLSGLNVNLNTGYAYIAGRWCKSDDSINFSLQPIQGSNDRYDAIVLALDLTSKKITIELLTDIDPDNVQIQGLHILPLYVIQVVRGASTIYSTNVADKRKMINSFPKICTNASKAYELLTSGIGEEIERIISLGAEAVNEAERKIAEMDETIKARSALKLGAIYTGLSQPFPATAWLLCDGSPVPAEYTDLIALIGANLPLIENDGFFTWIYALT